MHLFQEYVLVNKNVFLKDIWPEQKEINLLMNKIISPSIFKKRYARIFHGEKNWNIKSSIKRNNFYKFYNRNDHGFSGCYR